MYLTRLILNLRHRGVQYDLADCQRLHGRIMGAFPSAPDTQRAREHFGVLYRLEMLDEPTARLLVQSNLPPNWSALPVGYLAPAPDERGNPAVRPIASELERIQSGMRFRFRLRANPTKRISERNSDERAEWHGKRIELRRDDEQLAWLERKASSHGFRLVSVQINNTTIPDVLTSNAPKQHGRHNRSGKGMDFGVALFDGILEVTERTPFLSALGSGIGSAKAYGFGLLSIAAWTGGGGHG